jgi:dTDP-4-dehydrorhamnose 3,5-epimerase
MYNKLVSKEILDYFNFQIEEINFINSNENTLRGLHLQDSQRKCSKMYYCIEGSTTSLQLDTRKQSPTFGNYMDVELNSKHHKLLYVPHGIATGFYFHRNAQLIYWQSDSYKPESEKVYNPSFFIKSLNLKNPIMSEKDKNSKIFQDL